MLYDVLHSPGTADDVRALVRVSERFDLKPKGPWLEPACGSGRYVRAAVARGIRIAGFDASSSMVSYARDRMNGINNSMYALRTMRMESFDANDLAPTWTFELAFNLINTIRHVESDADVLEHLDRVHTALHPGGLYAIGLSLSMYGAEQPSEDTWQATRGSLSVSQIVQYTPAPGVRDRGEQVHSVLHVTRPTGSQTIPSSYILRSNAARQWQEILDRSAFRLVGCVDETGRDIESPTLGYAIWLLQR